MPRRAAKEVRIDQPLRQVKLHVQPRMLTHQGARHRQDVALAEGRKARNPQGSGNRSVEGGDLGMDIDEVGSN